MSDAKTPAAPKPPAPSPAAPKPASGEVMVQITKIDHRGNHKSFRFFIKKADGTLLTAKIDDDVDNYKEGQLVPASKLSHLAVANKVQAARFSSARAGSVDTDLLA